MKCLLLILFLSSCATKDYVEVTPVVVKLVRKEVFIRYPENRIGQYWQSRQATFFQMCEVNDTGYAIGTTQALFIQK